MCCCPMCPSRFLHLGAERVTWCSWVPPQAQRSACKFNPEREAQLSTAQDVLSKEVSQLQDEYDRQWAAVSARVDFEYDRASVARAKRGFDPAQVKGVVANLVTLKDSSASTALEAVAGGKLYNVIVDSAETGAALLKHGKLKRRVTIIPLDKISASPMTTEQIAAARRAGGTRAKPALTLVGYAEEVRVVSIALVPVSRPRWSHGALRCYVAAGRSHATRVRSHFCLRHG